MHSIAEIGVSNLDKAEPVYEEHEGWSEPIRGVRDIARLPVATRRYLDRIEELSGVPIVLIGTGPERTETIAVV